MKKIFLLFIIGMIIFSGFSVTAINKTKQAALEEDEYDAEKRYLCPYRHVDEGQDDIAQADRDAHGTYLRDGGEQQQTHYEIEYSQDAVDADVQIEEGDALPVDLNIIGVRGEQVRYGPAPGQADQYHQNTRDHLGPALGQFHSHHHRGYH